jgi:hypothetical protein
MIMLKPEEQTINLFNKALKQCIALNIAPTKENAKELVHLQILSIKEAIYDISLRESLPVKRTIEHWQMITTTLDKI